MPRRKIKLVPIDRCVVQLIANIMGQASAALALKDAYAYAGIVQFWQSEHSIIVRKLPLKR
jgi:hypothetical protein